MGLFKKRRPKLSPTNRPDGQEVLMYYAIIDWKRYQGLETYIAWTANVPSNDPCRETITCSNEHAADRVVTAANEMAACDWTPNQQPDERDKNQSHSKWRERLIDFAREHQPWDGIMPKKPRK